MHASNIMKHDNKTQVTFSLIINIFINTEGRVQKCEIN